MTKYFIIVLFLIGGCTTLKSKKIHIVGAERYSPAILEADKKACRKIVGEGSGQTYDQRDRETEHSIGVASFIGGLASAAITGNPARLAAPPNESANSGIWLASMQNCLNEKGYTTRLIRE